MRPQAGGIFDKSGAGAHPTAAGATALPGTHRSEVIRNSTPMETLVSGVGLTEITWTISFFIRVHSRHSRASVFHGRDGRAPFFSPRLGTSAGEFGHDVGGTPTLLEGQGPTGTSALPGAVFIRGDSRGFAVEL